MTNNDSKTKFIASYRTLIPIKKEWLNHKYFDNAKFEPINISTFYLKNSLITNKLSFNLNSKKSLFSDIYSYKEENHNVATNYLVDFSIIKTKFNVTFLEVESHFKQDCDFHEMSWKNIESLVKEIFDVNIVSNDLMKFLARKAINYLYLWEEVSEEQKIEQLYSQAINKTISNYNQHWNKEKLLQIDSKNIKFLFGEKTITFLSLYKDVYFKYQGDYYAILLLAFIQKTVNDQNLEELNIISDITAQYNEFCKYKNQDNTYRKNKKILSIKKNNNNNLNKEIISEDPEQKIIKNYQEFIEKSNRAKTNIYSLNFDIVSDDDLEQEFYEAICKKFKVKKTLSEIEKLINDQNNLFISIKSEFEESKRVTDLKKQLFRIATQNRMQIFTFLATIVIIISTAASIFQGIGTFAQWGTEYKTLKIVSVVSILVILALAFVFIFVFTFLKSKNDLKDDAYNLYKEIKTQNLGDSNFSGYPRWFTKMIKKFEKLDKKNEKTDQ
ncbi:hypothetical protein [[Mycoplasma] gypis]|uniref:Uncharacterized protein n=1 Tax=[Mycoplasma] gypis TaxID=92404 RepID=A0ABZ2RNF3_9BACT|nr:hypothetical protein [[Mycoplasma] gypis]MBN0919342.1 hypothetical protein [[Mycoplasma] gypis]